MHGNDFLGSCQGFNQLVAQRDPPVHVHAHLILFVKQLPQQLQARTKFVRPAEGWADLTAVQARAMAAHAAGRTQGGAGSGTDSQTGSQASGRSGSGSGSGSDGSVSRGRGRGKKRSFGQSSLGRASGAGTAGAGASGSGSAVALDLGFKGTCNKCREFGHKRRDCPSKI